MDTLDYLNIAAVIAFISIFFYGLYLSAKGLHQKIYSNLFIIVLSFCYIAWQVYLYVETGLIKERVFGWILVAISVAAIVSRTKKLKALKE